MPTKNIKMEDQKDLFVKTEFQIEKKVKYFSITISKMNCMLVF